MGFVPQPNLRIYFFFIVSHFSRLCHFPFHCEAFDREFLVQTAAVIALIHINVSLINVAQTFQFAKLCHKLKVCATTHVSRIRNGVSERNRND